MSGLDAAVVGAGVFGATAALELARRGRRVALLDQGRVPHPDAASTDISKVVRLDYGSDTFYTALMEEALGGWRAWNEAWDRPLFHETGFLVLSSIPMAPGSFEGESFALLTARGHRLERLDADEIPRRFPAWRPGAMIDGYHNPAGGWAESAEVVRRLIEEAARAGVSLRDQVAVEGLLEDRGRVRGVATAGGAVTADLVVVAGGAWTGALLPELEGKLSVVGQPVLHLAPADPTRFRAPAFLPFAADIARTGWYGFSANAADVVKVANHGPGVPVDPRGPRVFPAGAEARFRSFFADALPGLAAAPRAGERLCLYSESVDGDPWIARHPERAGLVVAAGGSGHAFKYAPLLGALIADAADGVEHRFGARFAWREVGERRFEEARFGEPR